MTRALPSQPSPQFLTYEMFAGEVQPNPLGAAFTPIAQTPSQTSKKKDITMIKLKPRNKNKPTYFKMIEEAVFENSERRKGASLATIKKYLKQKFDIDVKNKIYARRICKCIRESVSNGGKLRQMTGSGANGSFALPNDVRKKLEVKKEQLLIFKSRRSQRIQNFLKQAAKIKEQKPSKAVSRQTNTPVTRMSVK